MQRQLFACLLIASSALCASAALAATPVQGNVASVSPDKASFGLTAKKANLVVNVAPDTRYVLNDDVSDFATSIVTGNDVNVILNADGRAFVVIATTIAPKGTVKSVSDTQIVVTPKKGADITVKVNAQTKFILDKAPSTPQVAAAVGNAVTIETNPDGVALTVTAKTPKPAKTPATPATPTTPTAGN